MDFLGQSETTFPMDPPYFVAFHRLVYNYMLQYGLSQHDLNLLLLKAEDEISSLFVFRHLPATILAPFCCASGP